MKKTLLMFLLFMGIHPFGTIYLYGQDYLNIKYTDASYKYALISDISEITFNAGGTEMTVTLNDASSNTDAISTIVEATFDASILGGGSPLPVELVSFTAELNKYGVTLLWATATEVNNYGFEVERTSTPLSTDDIPSEDEGWETIGFVEGHGNSNSPKEYEFIDDITDLIADLSIDTLEYRLKQIDTDGSYTYYSLTAKVDLAKITDVNYETLPEKYELFQNYPNPFNPSTVISYQLPVLSNVQLKIYDILGREVAMLVNKQQTAGRYSIVFNATGLSSGIYIYKFTSGKFISTKKLQIIK